MIRPPGTDERKSALRRAALARRRSRSPAEIAAGRAAIAGHLRPLLADRSLLASYLPLPSEPLDPGVTPELTRAGVRVLLPLARAGAPLDWAAADPVVADPVVADLDAGTRPGALGIAEPTGAPLGSAAVTDAEVVLVPALLVDRRGVRLGRGGGHYDRTLPLALGRTIAVVFDDELVDELPAEEFDVPVSAAVTPRGGVHWFAT